MNRLSIFCLGSALLGLLLGLALRDGVPNLNLAEQSAHAVQPSLPTSEQQKWDDQSATMTPAEQINVSVYQQSNPSVVNISTRSVFVDHFFRMQREAEGSGSGIVFDNEGHILTNYHVVDGAKEIEVTMASNQTFPAELIGMDKENDIAVLKIDAPAQDLLPISLGHSNKLKVGQRVYALGNPFGWEGTLTTGIISSLNRDLPSRVEGRIMQSLIQTDAAMNPGNSGGPLLDTRSCMIGMCVAIATKTGQNSGVGFAIPIDRIRAIVPELIENGRLIHANIGITRVMETQAGLVVVSLSPNGPAAQAGIQGFRRKVTRRQQGPVMYETETIDRSVADRILSVDGEPMKTGVRFRDKIWEYKPGDTVTLSIVREGQQMEVPVTLGSD